MIEAALIIAAAAIPALVVVKIAVSRASTNSRKILRSLGTPKPQL